ncbi:MAG: hypothetical protein ABEJ78_09555 [Haloferacaceae archaeon]
MGSLAAGGAAAMGTGAFTSLTANRTATVNVAGDGAAYLQLVPGSSAGTPTSPSGPNAAYAEYNSDDELELNLDGDASGGFGGTQGDGVNPDAVTDIDEVFTIRNQGTQPVGVYISDTDSNDEVTFYANNSFPDNSHSGGSARAPSGTNGSGTAASDSIEGSGNYVEMNAGDYLEVSIQVDTTGTTSTGTLLSGQSFTVHADAGLI